MNRNYLIAFFVVIVMGILSYELYLALRNLVDILLRIFMRILSE